MPNSNSFSLPIRIKFENPLISSVEISAVLNGINQEVFQLEEQELEQINELIPGLPSVAVDAARYRMQQFRQKAFLVDKAKSGSVILEGSAALVALWLLKTTIGETVKEAWKESELHKKLKGYLNENMPRKIAMLADRLRHLHHKYYHRRWDLELKIDMEVASDDVGITIYVQSRGEELPPSKLDFSDEHHQSKPEEKKKSREA